MKFFKRNRKKILVIAGIILFVLVAFNLFKNKKKPETATIEKGNIKEELTLSGELDSYEKVGLAFQTGGKLAWVGAKEGDYVYKGQSLASLDTRALNINLKKTLNIYEISRNDFEQANFDNRDWQVNPDADTRDKISRVLDKYQLSLNNSVLDVEATSLQTELSSISTPISGIVTAVSSPVAGVNVSPSATQFQIVNPNTLFLSVTADQTDVPNIKIGDEAEIVFDTFPNDFLKGKVSKIAFTPKVGETGTVYEIKIDLTGVNNKDLKYRLGMTADANFILKEKSDVLMVQAGFVKEDANGKYLLVGSVKNRVYVETGIENGDKIEVAGKIKEGDIVFN
jgi:RND family efflux transporter MFP subunit